MPTPLSVAFLATADALEEEELRAKAAGLLVDRYESVRFERRPASEWLPRLATSRPPDLLLVTSRRGVEFGLAPYLRSAVRTGQPEIWAVGPRTAAEARRRVGRTVRQPQRTGSMGLLAALGNGRQRRVLHFRSDLAGNGLARALRGRGFRVREAIPYRAVPAHPAGRAKRARLLRAAVWVAASPSAIRGARRLFSRADWRAVGANTPLLVLGDRSAREARAAGFRRVVTVPPGRPQRFTQRLLDEARRAAR
jgi:uroporphyrinogen-III synthase